MRYILRLHVCVHRGNSPDLFSINRRFPQTRIVSVSSCIVPSNFFLTAHNRVRKYAQRTRRFSILKSANEISTKKLFSWFFLVFFPGRSQPPMANDRMIANQRSISRPRTNIRWQTNRARSSGIRNIICFCF